MRLSRRQLNFLIIACLGLISWVHLGQTDPEQQPLQDLPLAPLSTSNWQPWQSREGHEGVVSYFQPISAEQGTLRLLQTDGQYQQIQLPRQQWHTSLSQQLKTLTLKQPLQALLLQGPWPQQQMRAISAYVLAHAKIQIAEPTKVHMLETGVDQCAFDFAAGSRYLRAHWYPQFNAQQAPEPSLKPELPNRQQWQDFRLQQTQALRAQWLSHAGQLDIQTDIAYHRPPADYLRQLYQALGNSQKTAVQDYLDCRAASASRSAGIPQP